MLNFDPNDFKNSGEDNLLDEIKLTIRLKFMSIKSKNKRLKWLVFSLFFLFALNIIILSNNNTNIGGSLDNDSIEDFPLKLAGDNINITSPADTMYEEPTSGYYPATYGFESDDLGSVPEEWTQNSGTGCSVSIDSELGGHKKILKMDDQGSGGFYVYDVIESPEYGTIEFWIMTTDITKRTSLFFRDENLYEGFMSLHIMSSNWYSDSYESIIIPNVNAPQNNVWHHVSIHFETTTGGYENLSQWKSRFVIDGIDSGELTLHTWTKGLPKTLLFSSDGGVTGYTTYLDAVGYSWDPNYNVGNNKLEGLFLNFTTDKDLQWMGYSLDGQSNATILGNTTIPMPHNGTHTIQVFGNDSGSTMYESDMKQFAVNVSEIVINSPIDRVYPHLEDGVYPATYGFEDDVGKTGSSIPFIDSYSAGSGTSATVISNIDGHKDVLKLQDTGSGEVSLYNFFDSPQTSGTVEWWMRTDEISADNTLRIWLYEGGTARTQLANVDGGIWSYQDGPATWTNILTLQSNTWYHVRLDFDCGTDTIDLWLDGVKLVSDGPFISGASTIDRLRLGTQPAQQFTDHYDAIGYSWDPDYEVGDNNLNGYYPATYGFEGEVGKTSTGISIVDENSIGGGCAVSVVESLDGHNDILKLDDASGVNDIEINNTWDSSKTSGTVEFWWRTDNDDSWANIYLMNSSLDFGVITFGVDSGDFLHYPSGVPTVIFAITENQWYHIRVDFDTTTDKKDVYIDGVKLVDQANFRFVTDDGLSTMQLHTRTDRQTTDYFDAIGYSWDPNYDVGDNIEQGLLLNYTTNFDVDQISYSLDDQTTISISGNKTIPMPDDGYHKIQVFANDTSGKDYNSSVRYFRCHNNEVSIDIITPENDTYKEPMPGYYPGSIGYENDPDGKVVPYGWRVGASSADGYVQIEPEKDDHKKVMHLRKNGGVSMVWAQYFFPTKATQGTFEAWLYKDTNSGTDGSPFRLTDFTTTPTTVCGLLFMNGDIDHERSAGNQRLATDVFTPNTWHYLRIDFDFSQSGWQLQFDDTVYGSGYALEFWDGSTSEVEILYSRSYASGCNGNYGMWFDAIGYSWDPNYNIEDNKNEGLLLNFTSNKALEVNNYSIGGNTELTIPGMYVVPMPEDGLHTIQMTGTDWNGAQNQSELRYFTVQTKNITINTPTNDTYTAPMSGYYLGTYGFEGDADGSDPAGLPVGETPGTSVQVISEIDGHKKVVELYDNSGTQCYFENVFSQDYGTIELWFRTTSTTEGSGIAIFDSVGGPIMYLTQTTNKWRYWDGSWHDLCALANNDWDHVRFDFEHTAGGYMSLGLNQWYVYIDGTRYGPFVMQNLDPYKIQIATDAANAEYSVYYDAIGYSWDPDYNIGDNLNEGLLLNFTSHLNLDWMGYSLNGQSVVNITGNKTIPMPANGVHKIQIFGNDSLDNQYSSDLRWFTVNVPPADATAPSIENLPVDFSVFQGQTITFSWKIIEDNPDYYQLYRNGTLIKTASYDNDTLISYSYLNWTIGGYMFEIRAYDDYGLSDTETVLVSVIARPPEDGVVFLAGGQVNVINLILTDGLHIQIEVYNCAYINVTRKIINWRGIQRPWVNFTPYYYYEFTLFDVNLDEDISLLKTVTIRFYYNPTLVSNPANLHILLSIYKGSNVWVWASQDVTLNADENYVEMTTDHFSYYVLGYVETDNLIIIFFRDNMLIIIFLSAMAVGIPSAYIVVKKKGKGEKKDKYKGKGWDEEKEEDLEGQRRLAMIEEAKRKRERMLDRETTEEQKLKIRKEGEIKKPLKPKQKPKKAPKLAPKMPIPETTHELTEIPQESLEDIRKEVDIQEDVALCQVHKGAIEGLNYTCPKCKANYCINCANALSDKGEKCWVCEAEIKIGMLTGDAKKFNLHEMDLPVKSESAYSNLSKDDQIESIFLNSSGSLYICLIKLEDNSILHEEAINPDYLTPEHYNYLLPQILAKFVPEKAITEFAFSLDNKEIFISVYNSGYLVKMILFSKSRVNVSYEQLIRNCVEELEKDFIKNSNDLEKIKDILDKKMNLNLSKPFGIVPESQESYLKDLIDDMNEFSDIKSELGRIPEEFFGDFLKLMDKHKKEEQIDEDDEEINNSSD